MAVALLVLAFFFADPLVSGSLRLADVMEPVTLKKSSSRPCVLPWRLLLSLLTPLRMRSSLNCFSPHMNCTSSSSFGSVHFSSTSSGLMTSGSRKSFWASLCNQFSGKGYFLVSMCWMISSMVLCCLMSSTARLGPMPRMLSQ
uniref:Secreted protein n=1 Tax=Gallus gallus TaxID=9031 RepID=A0A8V0ZUB5_CHICK